MASGTIKNIIKKSSATATTNENGATGVFLPFSTINCWVERTDYLVRLLYSPNGLVPQIVKYNGQIAASDTFTVHWLYTD